MRRSSACGFVAAVVVSLCLSSIACAPVPALPQEFDVAVSTTDVAAAAINSGPSALADSEWSLKRTGDPNELVNGAPRGPYGGLLTGNALDRPPVGESIFLVRFDSQGAMVEVTENRFFLAEFYGATVPVGGGWWPTTLPMVEFHSASYGVQLDDRFGLAVVVHVRLGQLYAGRAILYAWGRIDGDQLTGTFGYLLDFRGSLLAALGRIADQYPIEGERVSE